MVQAMVSHFYSMMVLRLRGQNVYTIFMQKNTMTNDLKDVVDVQQKQ